MVVDERRREATAYVDETRPIYRHAVFGNVFGAKYLDPMG